MKDGDDHDRRGAIHASKIKNEPGWEPAYNFENGIRETIQWYLANQAWVKKVLNCERR